jgi:hypothetical protein
MLTAADRYAPGPGKRCHLDTLLEVLKWAGNFVRDDVIFNTIQLVIIDHCGINFPFMNHVISRLMTIVYLITTNFNFSTTEHYWILSILLQVVLTVIII